MERYGLPQGRNPKTRVRTGDSSRRQSRTIGWAMATVGILVAFYGMGFFASTGSVPVFKNPGAILDAGISRAHMLAGLLGIFLVSVSWNWVYNLANRIRIHFVLSSKKPPGKRRRDYGRVYRPVRKGVLGHAVWVAALIVLAALMIQMLAVSQKIHFIGP